MCRDAVPLGEARQPPFAKHQAPWSVPCIQTRCVFGFDGSQASHCMRWPEAKETCLVSTLRAAATIAVARRAARCMVLRAQVSVLAL